MILLIIVLAIMCFGFLYFAMKQNIKKEIQKRNLDSYNDSEAYGKYESNEQLNEPVIDADTGLFNKPIKTDKFHYDEKNDINYRIYLAYTGSAYILKTSKRTGKEYRRYLGPTISKDICEEYGVTYSPRRKSK